MAKLALLRVSAGLQEGHHAPGREHGGAAVGDKGEGDAGKRQNIHRAQHVQRSLKDQQAGGGTGGNGVEAGAAGPAAPHSEHRQSHNAQHRKYRDDKAPLLAQHAKHQIGVSGQTRGGASRFPVPRR